MFESWMMMTCSAGNSAIENVGIIIIIMMMTVQVAWGWEDPATSPPSWVDPAAPSPLCLSRECLASSVSCRQNSLYSPLL